MHKITFYPIGNADCCKVDLHNGKKLLFDFAHYAVMENSDDLRIDLAKAIKDDLDEAGRDYFDVVAFSHLDSDHISGLGDHFYLEHAEKYQGEDRIKINELWVPAAVILEGSLSGDARILRQEARHRLKKGEGIRVFSRPDALKDWLEGEGIKLEDRQHLITNAGKIVPGFTKGNDGVEFFAHSPFSKEVDGKVVDRNSASLILHATFTFDRRDTKFLYIGDTDWETLTEIVDITKYHGREERLKWDIYDIPHHCSYLALNSEKGEDKTTPVEAVKWLLQQGGIKGKFISCSKPIPNSGDDVQPPHRQAANCYKEYTSNIGGSFDATMEYPKASAPKPLVIEIDGYGAAIQRNIVSGGSSIISKPGPRAGAPCVR